MGKFEFKVDFHRETPQYEYINEKMNTLWKNMTNEMKMYNRNSTDIEKKIDDFAPKDEKKAGVLYGIGVGPGDPELMTIKAIQTIKKCDAIVLPAATKEEKPLCHFA